MTVAAANEQKVFILHDDGENSTAARLRTVSLAKLFDASGIVAYYRNAMHKYSVPEDNIESLRVTWSGQNRDDLVKSNSFIQYTVKRKGAYPAMIGLGQSRQVLELIAKEHNLKQSPPDPTKFPNSGNYAVTILTPTLFTTFYIAEPRPFSDDPLSPLPSIALPDEAILNCVREMISSGRRLYNLPQPDFKELKEAKALRKQQKLDANRQKEADKKIWKELKERQEAGEDVILPDLPLTSRQRRRREKLEAQMVELWGDPNNPNSEYPESYFDVIPSVIQQLETTVADVDKVSDYVIAPTAEPVVPCALELLNEMIHWLEMNVDITPEQEPRIDFVRGSILGRTTPGSGTSVDLCKMVVGPKGIGPILDAVGKNSHIDRFLLGNNIVGDEGAKIIAEFIASEKSRKVYNFYIAGNAIGPEGIRNIADALTTNTTVTALWLKRNPLLPLGGTYMASMLSINTTLETLDLVNTGIRDAGVVAVMEALLSNPASSLKHLYLGSNAETVVSGRAIGNYLRSGQSRLTSLFAGSSRLGDEGVVAIAEGLKVDKRMERLGLESVRCGDVGAKALADALKDHPAMIVLDLGFRKGTYELGEKANSITDDGLHYLGEQLFGSPETEGRSKIRSFEVTNNHITKDGARTFVDKYVVPNEQLLNVRLFQTGAERNIEVEHITKRLNGERKQKYFNPENPLTAAEQAERDVVKEALDPKHIAEIYSIYRGNM